MNRLIMPKHSFASEVSYSIDNDGNGEIRISFRKSGKVYKYSCIPSEIMREFERVNNKGNFLAVNVIPFYEGKLIGEISQSQNNIINRRTAWDNHLAR